MDPLLLNSSSAPARFNFTFSTADEDAAAAAVEELMSAFSTSLLVYREPRSVVLIACYVPLFLLAAVSNALVIYVVTRFHYMRSVTNYFLVNLSVADLLVTFICMPMAVGQSVHRLWLYGEAMCKLTYYLQGVSVGASVFTITAMSIDRYLAIRHPMAFRKVFNRKSTLMVIVVLWCVSLAIFVPLLWVRRTDRVVLGGEERRLYGVFCFVLVYAAPGTVVMLAYVLMGRSLCAAANAAASGRHPPFFHAGHDGSTGRVPGAVSCSSRVARERRRAARILLLLALLFAACWLPYNVLSLLLDLRPHPAPEVGGGGEAPPATSPTEELIMKAFPFTLLLGHANSAINPVLYCFMTNNFRRTVKAVLRSPCAGSASLKHRSRGQPLGRRGVDTTTEGAKLAAGKRKVRLPGRSDAGGAVGRGVMREGSPGDSGRRPPHRGGGGSDVCADGATGGCCGGDARPKMGGRGGGGGSIAGVEGGGGGHHDVHRRCYLTKRAAERRGEEARSFVDDDPPSSRGVRRPRLPSQSTASTRISPAAEDSCSA